MFKMYEKYRQKKNTEQLEYISTLEEIVRAKEIIEKQNNEIISLQKENIKQKAEIIRCHEIEIAKLRKAIQESEFNHKKKESKKDE